eukprot:3782089-Rhodomonas_salina.6
MSVVGMAQDSPRAKRERRMQACMILLRSISMLGSFSATSTSAACPSADTSPASPPEGASGSGSSWSLLNSFAGAAATTTGRRSSGSVSFGAGFGWRTWTHFRSRNGVLGVRGLLWILRGRQHHAKTEDFEM